VTYARRQAPPQTRRPHAPRRHLRGRRAGGDRSYRRPVQEAAVDDVGDQHGLDHESHGRGDPEGTGDHQVAPGDRHARGEAGSISVGRRRGRVTVGRRAGRVGQDPPQRAAGHHDTLASRSGPTVSSAGWARLRGSRHELGQARTRPLGAHAPPEEVLAVHEDGRCDRLELGELPRRERVRLARCEHHVGMPGGDRFELGARIRSVAGTVATPRAASSEAP